MADIDSLHHRPHEPFKDVNLNGYWDNDANIEEHDLISIETATRNVSDLPGAAHQNFRWYAFRSQVEFDSQEESTDASGIGVSLMGNQSTIWEKI